MKMWMGHFYENSKEWFVVWGKTRSEAINHIDCAFGEPDVRSMKPIKTPGSFCFQTDLVKYDDFDEELAEIKLHEDEFDLEDYGEMDEWIKTRMKNPYKETLKKDVSFEAGIMGIQQAEVMKSYAEQCPHCGEKSYFGPNKGCFHCGYKGMDE
jgi:hypothetical protein